MGKKRGDAQQALQAQITRQQLKAMQPFIAQNIQIAVGQVKQQLAKQQLSYFADINVRQAVAEGILCDKLGYTKDDLRELCLDYEDKAMSLLKVDREAKKGDYVRVEVFDKLIKPEEGKTSEYPELGQLFVVKNLLEEGSKHIYNQVILSEALVGMKLGEEKEESLEEHNVSIKIKLSRVSEPIKKEEVKEDA